MPNPDIVGREQILKVHVRKVPLAPDVNLKTVARGTPGFSGADLMNLVNEAALMAARRNKRMVTQVEFEDAKDKVMMGAERKSLVMTEEEKMLTAYHEGGHAIVALNVKATDPVHKATIIPRGRALGMVHAAAGARQAVDEPRADDLAARHHDGRTRRGGTGVRHEKVTSGAASDIEQATKTRPHDGDALGPLGRSSAPSRMARTRRKCSSAIRWRASRTFPRRPCRRSMRRSGGWSRPAIRRRRRFSTDKRDELETLAKGLLEFETLSGDEIKDLLIGKRPRREVGDRADGAALLGGADRRASRRPRPETGGMEPQPQA